MSAVHVFLLVLYGIFTQPDGTLAPSVTVATGLEGKAFTSQDDCEAAWAKIRTTAKQHPEVARAIGHSCDAVELEPVGSEI